MEGYLSVVNESRLLALHPVLLELIGDPHGKTALDFGCGDGAIAWALAESGAARVVAIDRSAEMIAAAGSHGATLDRQIGERVELHRGDEGRLGTLDGFDIVVCSLVLMMMPERERLQKAVDDLVGCLAPGGRLFLGLTHPCFRSSRHSTFYNTLPEGFDYWSSGASYEVHLHSDHVESEVVITDYHWTLQDVMQALRLAGAVVVDCVESGTLPESAGGFADDPAYIALEARRR